MKTFLLFLLMLGFTTFMSNAQQKILAMSVDANSPAGDTTEYGVPVIDSTTVFTSVMTVVLIDTTDIYQVHVKLGSSLHGTQYLSTAFDYGVNGSFGTTTYSQTGNTIALGLGSHAGMIRFYAEVQIERADHSMESPVLFSNF